MFVEGKFFTQGGDRSVGFFNGNMVSLSKRRKVALLLDVFCCARYDAFHVVVLENLDIVVLVLDGIMCPWRNGTPAQYH